MKIIKATVLAAISSLLCQCAFNSSSGAGGPPNMGGPTVEERNASIASEATGDFHYGRRYYVQKTRFWGYLRNPRQSADKAKLVIIREDRKLNPDRLPEDGPAGQRYGFESFRPLQSSQHHLAPPVILSIHDRQKAHNMRGENQA